MELTATKVGEIKREIEFTPLANPIPVKRTIKKVYHKKVQKYKSISKVKNAVISLLILWMMWNNQWIIKSTVFTDCVASGMFVCISFYILNSIDQWIVSWKEGGVGGR